MLGIFPDRRLRSRRVDPFGFCAAGRAMLIAQITDPHVRANGRLAYGVVDTTAAIARAIEALNNLDPLPDVALVTGDLVDFGRTEEYGVLRELLAPLKIPYFLLLGNHDERQNFRAAFATPATRGDADFVHYTVEDWPVRLIALDTVIPGYGSGRLCDRRMEWLAARLAEQPERPTIIAMHHPPFRTGIAHMDIIGLDNAEPLRVLVRQHQNIQRIVCGHLHRDITIRFAGTIAATCPSVSHQVALDLRPNGPSAFVMEPPAYQLHHWSESEGLRTHTAYIEEFRGPYPFFDEKGTLIG